MRPLCLLAVWILLCGTMIGQQSTLPQNSSRQAPATTNSTRTSAPIPEPNFGRSLPDRRANLPVSDRGGPEDANGAADIRESSTPSARTMALDAQRQRQREAMIRNLEFQKDGQRALVLFRELSDGSGRNIDEQTQKQLRKKTEELDQRLRRMIEFLDGRKPKPMPKLSNQPAVPTSQALVEFARIAEPLMPQLKQLVSQQRDVVDLKLQQTVLASLQTARERLVNLR